MYMAYAILLLVPNHCEWPVFFLLDSLCLLAPKSCDVPVVVWLMYVIGAIDQGLD